MTRTIRNSILATLFCTVFLFLFSSPAAAALTHTFSYIAGGTSGTVDAVLLSSREQNDIWDVYVVTLPADTTSITDISNALAEGYVYGTETESFWDFSELPPDDSFLIYNNDFTTASSNTYWREFYNSDAMYIKDALRDSGYQLAIEDVKGFGLGGIDPDWNGFQVIVQITDTGGSFDTTDKTALNEAIDAAEALNVADYWTADDRWDGTNTYRGENGGFWGDFQAALAAAKSVSDDPDAFSGVIDNATTALIESQTKLMPKTKINATLLHELVTMCVRNDLDSEKYTTKTWTPYSIALRDAKSLYDGLYGPLGDTSYTEAKQSAIDNAYGDLRTAFDNLMALTWFDLVRQYQNTIIQTDKLFRLSESERSKYTADSWDAYITARDEAAALIDGHPINNDMTGTAFEAYKTVSKAYYMACYGLKTAEEITASVRVADNYGAKRSEAAIIDSHTVTFNGIVTLSAGANMLEDLISAAGLDFRTEIDEGLNIHRPFLSVYINGVCVTGRNQFDPLHIEREEITVRDGDEIVFVQSEMPLSEYYISVGLAAYSGYKDYLATLSIKDVPVEPIEVKEGESFSLTVNKTAGEFFAYPAPSRPAANVSLIYSDPADSEAFVSGAVHDSGAVTASDGSADMALYQAGWYVVSAVDVREQTKGITGMDGNGSGGVYPNLAAGDSIIVHVLSLEEAELAAALDGYQDKLDALFAKYSKDEFGSVLWKQAQSAYYAAKSGVYSSTSLAGAQSALDTCKTTLDSLETQAKTANAAAVEDFTWYLDRLPNIDQISQGYFTQGDVNFYQLAAAIYNGMSAYQKGQLTAAQVAQYQALTAAYGADGSGLPEARAYTLTVKCEPAAYGDKVTFQTYTSTIAKKGDKHTYTYYLDQSLNEDFSCSIVPGGLTYVQLAEGKIAEGYEYSGVTWSGAEMTQKTGSYVFNLEELNNPHSDVTVTVHVRQAGELTLEEAKDAAKTALTAEFGTYDNGYYTVGRWNELVQAYKAGLAAIAAATNKAAVDSAKTDAFAAMAAVPERSPGDYGSVKVEFYNTTYPGGMGYDETAPFISKTMELTADDTMMSVALRAAHEEEYTWTGTGGSGYNINYLSSLSKEGKTLAEFGNGSESGWMGTLNDWFVHQSWAAFGVDSTDLDMKLRDADIIKVMYSSKGLGADLGGIWGNGDTSLKALAVDGITLSNNFSATTLNYVATVNGSLFGSDISVVATAANKNFQVRTFLNTKNTMGWYRPGETIPAAAGDIIYIGVAEKAWPTMNKVGAEAVAYTPTWYTIYVVGEGDDSITELISLIDALPIVDSASLTNKADIDFAKTYYDTLSESDQAKVTNVAKLNDLLQRMDDLQQVVDIKTAIDALPAAANVTKTDAEAINAVFDTYTALKQWQKNLIAVSYTDKLNAVKEAIDVLTGDPAAIVTNLINELPAADQITLDDQAAVEKARTAYDNLSTEKQNEVTSATLNKLTAAEKALAALIDAPSKAVKEQINALPATVTLTDKDAVSAARAAYEVLSESQKDKVPATVMNKLTTAEGTIKALEDAAILPVNNGKVTTLKPEAAFANETATVNLADATVSNLGDSAKSNGSTEIVIAPKDLGDANPVTFGLSQTALGSFLEKTGAELTLVSPIANVTLSNAALTALNAAGDGPISIIIEQTAGDTVKVTVKTGDTVLTDIGAITVKITASDIDENTVVVRINSDGSKTVLNNVSIVSNLSASAVTVSPKYSLLVPVTGSVALQLVNNAQSFTDISGHWAASYIEFVTARGLMQGTGNNKFSPEVTLTRGMLVTILWRLDGEPAAQGGESFSDVAADKYYAAAVAWAAENEIVTGVGNGKFKPEDNVSRQDMVVIMARYAAYCGLTATGDMSLIEGYSDFGQISDYAKEAFAWVYQAEIVNGTSKTALSPQGNATRAQFAAVLQRFITVLN